MRDMMPTQLTPFADIMRRAVEATPGAIGGAFADAEGEIVNGYTTIDREEKGTGEWFGGPGGWPLVRQAMIIGFLAPLAIETFAISFGWLREWFPNIPQLFITALNPGTLITAIYGAYSVWLVRRYESARAGGLGLFTCFLCCFFDKACSASPSPITVAFILHPTLPFSPFPSSSFFRSQTLTFRFGSSTK